MFSFLSSTQFWISFAFCGVFITSYRPVSRALKSWGLSKATLIKNEYQEALLQKEEALKLLQQQKKLSKEKETIRKSIFKKALRNSQEMKKDIEQQIKEQLTHQTDEINLKLTVLKDNLILEIKEKILLLILQKIQDSHIKTGPLSQSHLNSILTTLDFNEGLFKEAQQNNPLLKEQNQGKILQQLIEQSYHKLQKESPTRSTEKSLDLILQALDLNPV